MSVVYQTQHGTQPVATIVPNSDTDRLEAENAALRRENTDLAEQLAERDRALSAMACCLEEVENLLKSHLEAAD